MHPPQHPHSAPGEQQKHFHTVTTALIGVCASKLVGDRKGSLHGELCMLTLVLRAGIDTAPPETGCVITSLH